MSEPLRAKSTGTIRIGISGWQIRAVARHFLSQETSAKGRAKARRFHPQHHRNQRNILFTAIADSFHQWAGDVPEGFVFAVKGPNFITHMRRLKDVDVALANFFASGILRLGPTLGPILWQLPPNFKFDPRTPRILFQAASTRHGSHRETREASRQKIENTRLDEAC